MKFKCGETDEERHRRWAGEERHRRWAGERLKVINTPWKKWFAWWPIEISEGDCRWLEMVEYKPKYTDYANLEMVISWGWEYRAIDKE